MFDIAPSQVQHNKDASRCGNLVDNYAFDFRCTALGAC